jgi:hypothetical protein
VASQLRGEMELRGGKAEGAQSVVSQRFHSDKSYARVLLENSDRRLGASPR